MTARSSASVRRATADDLDRVASVWHQSASAMDAANPHMPTCREMRARIDRELEAGWQLFVAEHGGLIVGMLALKPGEAVLDQLFVLPENQASGIGTMLMDVAKEIMPNGFSLRMAAGNERAAQFYRRRGLCLGRTGTHPFSGQPVCYYDWKGG
jgi:GNAT superfamily N-acetyltransferase